MDSAQIVAAIANNKADRSGRLRCVVIEAKGYYLHLLVDWKWHKVKTDCDKVVHDNVVKAKHTCGRGVGPSLSTLIEISCTVDQSS